MSAKFVQKICWTVRKLNEMFNKFFKRCFLSLYCRWNTWSLKSLAWYRTFMFRMLYVYLIGNVEGGNNIKVFQWVSIKGPGRVKIGKNVRFGYPMSPSFKNSTIEIITKLPGSILTLGDNCTINNNNSFVVVKNIVFNEKCKTGHDVQIFDSDLHATDIELRHTGGDMDGNRADVILEENVMVGAMVAIGPGTIIGKNSVVGMGSILKRRKYPANTIIVGNPARPVKFL